MFDFLPDSASAQAVAVDRLFLLLLSVASLVIVFTLSLLVYFALRYRHTRDVNRSLDRRHARRLEYSWLVLPLVVFVFVFFTGGATLYLNHPDDTPEMLLIYAVGKQWMWRFEHPGGQREINALHLPVDRPVRILLASEDVIHSFYVPALRLKQDVVPGYLTDTQFTLDRTGDFHLFCAEFCGTDHAGMRGRLVATSSAGYSAWLEEQAAAPSRVEQGARLYREHGCGQCHDRDPGTGAPPLEHLYGSSVALADGSSVNVDENYLRKAMLTPDSDVRAGYDPNMPSYDGLLDELGVMDLIAYIRSGPAEAFYE